jgi:ArsR family transcriptional regulator, arsenate/arsenite/antimonite-responsive transcriptional repressor
MTELRNRFLALADETRLRILLLLDAAGELCLCHVQELLEIAPSTASRHLSLLRAAGLVAARREGRWVHFRLDEAAGGPWLALLRDEAAARRESEVLRDRLASLACQQENPCCP